MMNWSWLILLAGGMAYPAEFCWDGRPLPFCVSRLIERLEVDPACVVEDRRSIPDEEYKRILALCFEEPEVVVEFGLNGVFYVSLAECPGTVLPYFPQCKPGQLDALIDESEVVAHDFAGYYCANSFGECLLLFDYDRDGVVGLRDYGLIQVRYPMSREDMGLP